MKLKNSKRRHRSRVLVTSWTLTTLVTRVSALTGLVTTGHTDVIIQWIGDAEHLDTEDRAMTLLQASPQHQTRLRRSRIA